MEDCFDGFVELSPESIASLLTSREMTQLSLKQVTLPAGFHCNPDEYGYNNPNCDVASPFPKVVPKMKRTKDVSSASRLKPRPSIEKKPHKSLYKLETELEDQVTNYSNENLVEDRSSNAEPTGAEEYNNCNDGNDGNDNESEAKLAERRRRNRLAAERSRKRRTQKIEELQALVSKLSQDKARLEYMLASCMAQLHANSSPATQNI